MLETLKKGLLAGVGMALRSKNEIDELAKEFAESSKMDQAEARQFLEACRVKYDEARAVLDSRIEAGIEKILTNLDLPTRADIKGLHDRIDALADKLEKQD